MNVVFFGTPSFASDILEKILDHGISVVGVVTKPDKPQGRSKKLIPSPVKQLAEKRLSDVPLFQPEKISTPEYYEKLAALNADLFVVVAYGEIIKQPLLDMPKLGCVNVHGSLLPAYRGAAPIQHALLDGQKKTGVSIMYLVRKMDAGPVIETAEVAVGENMMGGELYEQLCALGGKTLIQVLERFQKFGKLPAVPQDENLVTFAPKVTPEMMQIDWTQPAQKIHNQIRAFAPKPNAWCNALYKGESKKVKIGVSRYAPQVIGEPGAILVNDDRFFVACGEGGIEVEKIQLEGKRMMTITDFLCGIDPKQLLLQTTLLRESS